MEVFDKFTRPMRDLRISVIDVCNFRCLYCMPPDQDYEFFKNDEKLSPDEFVRLANIFVKLGVQRIRITGGEPLLHPKLNQIISEINEIENLVDLSITTNASLLTEKAPLLKEAGIRRITVSLDSLDPEKFKLMNGGRGNLDDVLSGIDTAIKLGFKELKINTVIEKGINEYQILPLTRYAREKGLILRFIEFMDVGNKNEWNMKKVLPSAEVRKIISSEFELKARESNFYGEVAGRYEFADKKGEVGFISSVTEAFCSSCTRARISSDGKLYTCLFSGRGFDLKTLLRDGSSDQSIAEKICGVWENRSNRYSEERQEALKNPRTHDIVEMFKIGG
ncbi:GTP 3',8-cyclase MoaA [Lentisphaera profundi]|uniref:GTP 3',8-cyclase n=2 Tax=Lentisphaera profundi TaxID=1658616 RepID=A0ABY7VQ03_9BACT|nr:GTP 3',8-cyclase MoaA [Lentisphaera profundi]WDE96255.1 GTP 3',8-cyclase MoaA [Lentisphaera profundi]